ncbi:MAG: hypothetical protein JWP75_1654, partial [Frondihabitans sp.]|nr:hypothetical protein [Frondihabitans sp.]
MLQLPVMPGRETAWLVHSGETVGGYMVQAQDVVWADSPAKLFEVHGLGFPGSPFTPDMPFIDVVRFRESPGMIFTPPLGRPSDVELESVAGPFVDHPPFRSLGFSSGGERPVPVWWLDPVRFPPHSEVWRVHANGPQQPLAIYPHVAEGWVPVNGFQVDQDHALPPSDLLGTFGTWQGSRVLVDLVGEGEAVVGSAVDMPGQGLSQSSRGVWWKTVPVSEVSDIGALRVTARWRDVPFQVVSRFQEGDRQEAQIV